jgi:hypothetical protein
MKENMKKIVRACIYYNLSKQYNDGMKWDLVAKTVIADNHPQAVLIEYT